MHFCNRFAVLFLGLATSVWADLVYIDGGGRAAVDDDRATAIELVHSSVAELGHTITEDAGKADYILRPRLLRLGSSYILKLEKRKANQTVFASQLKAQQAEELDKVARRLTRAVIANEPAEKAVRVGEVTNEESVEGTQRRPALAGFHFALGPATLTNMGTSGLGYSFSLGKAWDVNAAMIRARVDFFGKGSAFGLDGGLSANVFLSRRDIAPFVGGEFGFGVARVDTGALFSDDLHFGFWTGPIAGVQMFRTSTVQIEVSLKWSILLASAPFGNPNYLALRVGLFF